MSIIQGNAHQGSTRGFYPKVINGSLRFNDDDSAYLTLTPTGTSGGRTKFTYSGWVKIGTLSTSNGFHLLNAPYASNLNGSLLMIDSNDEFYAQFRVYTTGSQGSFDAECYSNMKFRDPSAWYHIVFAFDSTASESSRMKLWVNGVLQSFRSVDWPGSSTAQYLGSEFDHNIGRWLGTSHGNTDGYIANVHFIDGQALTADDFGELKNGVWVAKDYAGTFGTNGFYLTFEDDTEVEAFNTVLYKSTNGVGGSVTGVGFKPDLIWVKSRSGVRSHVISDSVRGPNANLFPDLTNAESTASTGIQSFDSDGFTYGTTAPLSDGDLVAWCWKAGDSNVSNTDGTITSTVRANDTYGFSIIDLNTPASGSFTVGHGLSSAPDFLILKRRDAGSSNWVVGHTSMGWDKYMFLQSTGGQSSSTTAWSNTAPTSSVINLDSSFYGGSANYICYCWSETTGYSKFGSYTGNGSTSGPTVTCGFKPAFVLVKASSVAGERWCMHDNTRTVANGNSNVLFADDSLAENTTLTYDIDFLDTGFQIKTSHESHNQSGQTYIYAAFADTREAAFWLDQSGNDNDWQPVNLDHNDTVADSPTNNFCTLNSALSDSHFNSSELSNGNLFYNEGQGNNGSGRPTGTFSVTSGKWYWEVQVPSQQNSRAIGFTRTDNIAKGNVTLHGSGFTSANSVVGIDLSDDTIDQVDKSGTHTQHASGLTGMADNDIFGISVDLDGGTFQMYRNGSAYGGSYSLSDLSDWQIYGMTPTASAATYQAFRFNFGQQGFTYTPPTDHLALSTASLPDPAINPAQGASPEDYFNTVTYTGTGVDNDITGVGFQPDFVWIKSRGADRWHQMFDVIRGQYEFLSSNTTNEEIYDVATLESFDSDGFNLNTSNRVNGSSEAYVAWNWKANGSGVSNNDGSITSTVSANTTSGFSIVSYTGNSTAGATVGHGLDATPDMFIVKNRDRSADWHIYHTDLGATKNLKFTTASVATQAGVFNNTEPTSTVFSLGTNSALNASGEDIIAYCFHSVEGFSKFGSYVGNGSTDGPFVYTGFRPAFVMFKKTNGAGDWNIRDTSRSPSNTVGQALYPNLSFVEYSGTETYVDILSNGFKLRGNWNSTNASGGTYIYACFSENPFKYSNAR